MWFRVIKSVIFSLLLVIPGITTAQDVPPPATEVVILRESAPDPAAYRLEEVVSGFFRPIYLTNAGDDSGRLFVLEQAGKIWIVQDGAILPEPFLDIANLVSQDVLSSYSERGLLGLAFHPNYAENGTFFVHYNDPQGGTVLARYQVSADNLNQADPDSAMTIFTHPQPYANHNGGQIAFGADSYLYFALGDGGSANDPLLNGQNPQTLLGTILRLDVDGDAPYTIPEDNPAFTVDESLAEEVWAWGLRNPYRFSFDRATGDIYIADVGQNLWEEVNFLPADHPGGANFGWNIYEGTHPFAGQNAPEGMIWPIAEYDHGQGCSVTGGYVYRGTDLSGLLGVYFYGDYCSGQVWAAYRDLDSNWQSLSFMSSGQQVSSFGEDEAGELYLLGYGGTLLKLVASEN